MNENDMILGVAITVGVVVVVVTALVCDLLASRRTQEEEKDGPC
jgi:hypothetical protein